MTKLREIVLRRTGGTDIDAVSGGERAHAIKLAIIATNGVLTWPMNRKDRIWYEKELAILQEGLDGTT